MSSVSASLGHVEVLKGTHVDCARPKIPPTPVVPSEGVWRGPYLRRRYARSPKSPRVHVPRWIPVLPSNLLPFGLVFWSFSLRSLESLRRRRKAEEELGTCRDLTQRR